MGLLLAIERAAKALASGWYYNAAAFAEADAGEAGFFAVGAEDDFVAVQKEGALFAVGELDWVGSALGDFEEAALRAWVWAGDGSAGEEIAFDQIAAVAGVVGDHLGECPIEVAEIAGA